MSNNEQVKFSVGSENGVEMFVDARGYFHAETDYFTVQASTRQELVEKIKNQIAAARRRKEAAARAKTEPVRFEMLKDGKIETFELLGYKTRGAANYEKGFVIVDSQGVKKNLKDYPEIVRGSATQEERDALLLVQEQIRQLRKTEEELMKKVVSRQYVSTPSRWTPSQTEIEDCEKQLVSQIKKASAS